MESFSPAPALPFLWKSRKRSASGRSIDNAFKEESLNPETNQQSESMNVDNVSQTVADGQPEDPKSSLSDRRKALFEPLEPIKGAANSQRTTAEDLLPPPDFDSTSYPKGWLIGKKRKLVNVDVVESMRRIAIQEMNRKDREIDGLNEQLEEDSRCLEHLQLQLLQERSKRADVERENSVLQNQISMLMNMLEETEAAEEGASEDS